MLIKYLLYSEFLFPTCTLGVLFCWPDLMTSSKIVCFYIDQSFWQIEYKYISNGRSNSEVVGLIPTEIKIIFLYLVWFPDSLY